MIPVLLWLALVVAPGDQTKKLSACVQRKDHACISSILSSPNKQDSAEYLAMIARACMIVGRPKDAASAIDRALQMQPGNYDHLMEQGWIYQKSDNQVSAIHSFLMAAQLKPKTPATFYELGMSFFLLNEYRRAAPHFRHVLALDPNNDRAEFMLGILDIMNNVASEAKPHYERALQLQPKNPHYLLHYGVLLNQLGQPRKAIEMMLEAEKLDPSNPLTHYNLGRVYLESGRFAEARGELEASIRLRPDLTPAFYKLGTIYRALGNSAKAREALKRYETLKQKEEKEEEDPADATLLLDR
jgi:tetratricopeptide (TPR) repeat protein